LLKVGGLFPNALYNVSGFSLPPIITDRHHITEKLLSMAKNSKQSINHIFVCLFTVLRPAQEFFTYMETSLHVTTDHDQDLSLLKGPERRA
jgi:hypothetical protein